MNYYDGPLVHTYQLWGTRYYDGLLVHTPINYHGGLLALIYYDRPLDHTHINYYGRPLVHILSVIMMDLLSILI